MRLSPTPVLSAITFVLLLLGASDGDFVLDAVGEVEVGNVSVVAAEGVDGSWVDGVLTWGSNDEEAAGATGTGLELKVEVVLDIVLWDSGAEDAVEDVVDEISIFPFAEEGEPELTALVLEADVSTLILNNVESASTWAASSWISKKKSTPLLKSEVVRPFQL
jgi:hypothetical protein